MNKKTEPQPKNPPLTVEQLENLPTYQPGVIVKAIQAKFFEHKSQGRDGFARALAMEWVVK